MRGTWIRRLVPAAVVGIVLAFSYIAPAQGMFAPPVKTFDNPNCGRNGYGYHGGKHNFACPSPPSESVISSSPLPPRAVVASPGAATQPAARPGGESTVQSPGTSNVVTPPVPVEVVTEWRNFAEFLLRQLSSG